MRDEKITDRVGSELGHPLERISRETHRRAIVERILWKKMSHMIATRFGYEDMSLRSERESRGPPPRY